MRRFATMLLVLSAIAPGAAAGSEERALAKGRAAAKYLNDNLPVRLAELMKGTGPAGAVAVVPYQVQALLREAERDHGVKVKRTSLNLRNPANAPDPFEREMLKRLSAQVRRGSIPEEMFERRWVSGKTVYRYAQPVVAAKSCLPCHGSDEEVSDETRSNLKARYPDDAAMGYRVGDLMGIVSVVIERE